MNEHCYNCRFFLPCHGGAVMPETDFMPGSCRRHAPPSPPEIRGAYWCGDWQMNLAWIEERQKWLEIRQK